jgi:hypothetical protein
VAQDTVFVQKHKFDTPVRNIFLAEQKIHAKTGDGLFVLDKASWKKLNLKFDKSFVFFNDGYFQSEFIPNEFLKDAEKMSYLIPQRSLVNCTMVHLNNQLFVSVGGSLFQYEIRPYFRIEYPNKSIRQIYLDDQLKVVATYSGIYINDTLRKNYPPYSNGHFTLIKGQYYLSTDELFKVFSKDSVQLIKSGQNIFAGHSRKLVEWKNKVYSLNTNSINELMQDYNLMPIHKGFDYSDLEVMDSLLVFSTYEGKLFAFDQNEVQELANVGSRIREIFIGDGQIYIAADNGAFKIQPSIPTSLVKILNKPFCVDIEQDRFKNLWIATENGLFILPKSNGKPVSLVADVEFNRYGMTHHEDKIYAGSINGLYLFDIYTIEKGFLPQYFQMVSDQNSLFWRSLIFKTLLFGIPLLIIGYWIFTKLYKSRKIVPCAAR